MGWRGGGGGLLYKKDRDYSHRGPALLAKNELPHNAPRAAGYQGPVKIELRKGVGLLDSQK